MFIRTPRLFLRPAWAEDARALHRAIACWDVVKHLARAPWPYTLADAEAFVAGKVLEPGEASFLIFARTAGDPELVGSIGFGAWQGPGAEAELGYWIAPDHWNQGYATEAGRAVLALAFDGLRLPSLRAAHFVDNPASGVVLEKLGFVATGETAPYPCRARGSDVPAVVHVLTRDAWAGRMPLALAA
jgi:RimJ/RimL family protein N-acetyltransferase